MKEFEKQLAKVRRWCAMQERCLVEVKIHANSLGFSEEATEKVISQLVEEGFINEERFAQLYAGGKFRNKKWGRERIIGELMPGRFLRRPFGPDLPKLMRKSTAR